VGNISATIDQPNRVAELAILLGERTLWNCGIGYDSWYTAMNFLLAECGIRKVTAGTMSVNAGMLALMAKSGMIREGRLVGHFLLNDQPVDMIIAARIAADVDRHRGFGSTEEETGRQAR
jgi:RimJ/RimL family protein N-acetyltransferase